MIIETATDGYMTKIYPLVTVASFFYVEFLYFTAAGCLNSNAGSIAIYISQ